MRIGSGCSRQSSARASTSPLSERRSPEQIWLVVSGTLASIRLHPSAYAELIASLDSSSSAIQQIKLDIRRTPLNSPEQIDELERVLSAFAARNPDVGYCQGLNFIVGFFLNEGFSEEEAFWLLCFYAEEVVGCEYYKSMNHCIADLNTFVLLLKQCDSPITKFLSSNQMDPNFILLPYFLLGFLNVSSPPLNRLIFDSLLTGGSDNLFRVGLAVFSGQSEFWKKLTAFSNVQKALLDHLTILKPAVYLQRFASWTLDYHTLHSFRLAMVRVVLNELNQGSSKESRTTMASEERKSKLSLIGVEEGVVRAAPVIIDKLYLDHFRLASSENRLKYAEPVEVIEEKDASLKIKRTKSLLTRITDLKEPSSAQTQLKLNFFESSKNYFFDLIGWEMEPFCGEKERRLCTFIGGIESLQNIFNLDTNESHSASDSPFSVLLTESQGSVDDILPILKDNIARVPGLSMLTKEYVQQLANSAHNLEELIESNPKAFSQAGFF